MTRKKAAALRLQQIRAKTPDSFVHGNGSPRFVADVMLGKLAKWLRIAGFDTLYSNRFSDDELIAISNREGRILLTLDTRLLVRKTAGNFIYLESWDLQDQIRQILESTRSSGLPVVMSRCLCCNNPLIPVARDAVRDRVPPYVFRTQTDFKTCPKCRRVFWAGTHRRAVMETLKTFGIHKSGTLNAAAASLPANRTLNPEP